MSAYFCRRVSESLSTVRAVPKFSVRLFYFCFFTGLFIKGEYETKNFFILEKFARNIHKR